MGISGTRFAMGVLMGGMLMITIIAKNWKALLGGIFISIGIFVFFYYTNIGSGNQYIHKMRSSFHPTEAASYLVRVENRQRMKELMAGGTTVILVSHSIEQIEWMCSKVAGLSHGRLRMNGDTQTVCNAYKAVQQGEA